MNSKKKNQNQASLLKVAKFSQSILDRRDRRHYIVLAIFQIILNILDLFGLVAVIVLISVAGQTIGTIPSSQHFQKYMTWFGLNYYSNEKSLFILTLITVSIFVIKTFFSILINRKTFSFLSEVSAKISAQTLENLISHNRQVAVLKNSSEIVFSLSSATRKIIFLILGNTPILLADLFLLLLISIFLFYFDPITTLLVVSMFGSVFVVSHSIISRKTYSLGEQTTKNDLIANSLILNMLRNQKEIIVRGSAKSLLRTYNNARMKHFKADSELIFLQYSSRYILDIAVPFGAFLLIATQAFLFSSLQGAFSLAIFLVAGVRLAPAIIKIQSNLLVMKTVAGELNELQEILNHSSHNNGPIDVPKELGFVDFNHVSIVFKNVSYKYSEQDNFELKNVNMEIKPGEFVAIVGPSGSGKSTLIDLALGILEPKSGEVLFGGQIPKRIITQSPGQIAYLPQESMIIGGSIRDNILFGVSPQEFDDKKVWEVLEKTNLSDFVNSLEFGLDTQIGEFGVALSGGQRQRLSLARALITVPKIIILDEVTSALDLDSENLIKNLLSNLRRERTLIVISHSENLIEIADRFITVENGHISSN